MIIHLLILHSPLEVVEFHSHSDAWRPIMVKECRLAQEPPSAIIT